MGGNSLKNYTTSLLGKYLDMEREQIYQLLELPPNRELGDVAFPCFTLAKALRSSPQAIAEDLATRINADSANNQVKTRSTGPYLNFYFERAPYALELLERINTGESTNGESTYGNSTEGNGQTIVVDFSSPNIAKPFSLPHLRSTMIGNAIINLYKALGYTTVGINHLGDWGTQFGKEIVAYKLWGNDEMIRTNPIQELVSLYVRFHEEVEERPELEDEARQWFKRLEDGDEEAVRLWQWFVEESIKEFEKIYRLLGVEFDHYMGESFYNDKMERVLSELREKNLLVESEGALVVELGEDQPPAIIQKQDGSSIYATRDLAAALYRKDTFDFTKVFYVVGNEQKLHFEQVFAVLKKMGYDWAKDLLHVPFGLMLFEGKKMSTRQGRIVLLEEVLRESIEKADKIIEEKNPDLTDRAEVAESVGVGAIIFNDLKNNRLHEVNFSWAEALNFEGETGPYIQYSYARIQSLIRRSGVDVSELGKVSGEYLTGKASWDLLYLLGQYPETIRRAAERLEPSVLARYLLDLATTFNQFYHQERVLTDNEAERDARLALTNATAKTLQHGLKILGLKSPATI
jgi:arginyl-tRNA synthetase